MSTSPDPVPLPEKGLSLAERGRKGGRRSTPKKRRAAVGNGWRGGGRPKGVKDSRPRVRRTKAAILAARAQTPPAGGEGGGSAS